MTSIDDLFKRPGLPSNKRKFEASKNPDEIYKAAKLAANGDAKGGSHSDDAGETDDDGIAGPNLPAEDEEEQQDADEEGRFFGSGITRNTMDVLDFIDKREDAEQPFEKIDLAWLRRLALNFERKISKNSELRAKFEDDPAKFMVSEADLDQEVKALSVLVDHTSLYPEFARIGCVNSLVSLLAHENTDIAIDAMQILAELTDEDVDVKQVDWNALVDAMLEADAASLLVQNFERLNEKEESDRNGVYHTLSFIENLSSRESIARKIAHDSGLLEWLLARIQKKESPITQNKQYSAEVLAILLQSAKSNTTALIKLNAIDTLLQILAAYRKRDPQKNSEEEEYVENIFDCLVCLADEPEGKRKFVEAEGVELCLIMLKEGSFSKPRALRLLDHAAGTQEGAQVCEQIVEAAGLKPMFAILMKQNDNATIEHLIGIFASMLKSLPGNSAPRIRTLAKFMEKDYEKIQKLVKHRREYGSRLLPVNRGIQAERKALSREDQEDMADEWLSRRLDAGLFCFQTIDVILAWLVAEDAGARRKIIELLAERDESLSDIKSSLQEQLDGLQSAQSEDEKTGADVLRTLIGFLS